MFLLDVQQDQVGGHDGAARSRGSSRARRSRACCRCCARGSPASQGQEVSLENYEDVRGRGSLAREYTVTYRPALERNESVVAGAFWDATPSADARGVDRREPARAIPHQRRRHDALRRAWAGSSRRASRSVRRVDWSDSRAGGFMFVFRPGRARSGAARLHLVLPRTGRSARRAPSCRARSSRASPTSRSSTAARC